MHLIYSDSVLLKKDSTPGIFLAGPSPRGYGEGYPKDWRDDAIKIFEELKFKGKIFIPRPSNGHMDNQFPILPNYSNFFSTGLNHIWKNPNPS